MIRHLFILNPEAGVHNPVKEATERIKKAFILNTDRENEKYDIVLTKKKGDATEIARRACAENPGFTRIYACGGDGTLNEVVNGAVNGANVAICPVPVGSGNDFVRHFESVPKEKFLDISSLIHASLTPCDVLKCGDRYSINNFSVGLDAYTAKRQQKVKRIPLVSGGAAYKLALGYSFLSSMKNPIRFEVDGENLDLGTPNVTLGVMGNGKFYGGGFKATPLAEINDGWMDFITVRTVSRLEFLKYVGDYKSGRHLETMPFVKFLRCKKVQLFSEEPIVMQGDGEIFQSINPTVELLPSALQLILPKA